MRLPAAAIAPERALRRIVAAQPDIREAAPGAPTLQQPTTHKHQRGREDLPAALDERVRLVGEW
jgi:hypothetical protein